MRRKIIKSAISILLSATFLGLAITTFSGCKNVYDYKPESYGEWEGNYIYKGNYRSKTTGEDGEVLVSEVVYEGNTYQVEAYGEGNIEDGYFGKLYYYFYYGDFVYLVLRGECSNDETFSSKKFLVRYDLKEKTQETLLAEDLKNTTNDFDWISYVDGEKIVVMRDETWSAIDLNGNEIEEEFPQKSNVRVLNNEYLIYENYVEETLVYRTFADPTERKIMDLERNVEYSYKFTENENQKGILLLNKNKSGGDTVYDFKFFDLETGTLRTVAENFNKKVKWVDENYNYFITYEQGLVQWTEEGNSCFGVEEKSATTNLNCKLYAVDYENCSIREVYTFDPNRNCTQVNILGDGNIYVTQVWWEDYKFLKNDGGKEYARYRFDTESETFTLVEEDVYDELFDLPFKGESVTCGEYEYYKTEVYVPLMWGRSFAYSLVRTNGEKTETLQFCTTYGKNNDLEEDIRAYHEVCLGVSDFIVLPY